MDIVKRKPTLNAFHEFGDRDTQRISNGFDVSEGQISFAAFDSAHVGPIQPAGMGETFLGVSVLLPQFPHAATESHQNVLSLDHASIGHSTPTIDPRVMSTIPVQ